MTAKRRHDVYVQIRVDEKTKNDALDVLTDIGIDMPTAVRLFLKRIVIDRGLPFSPNVTQFVNMYTKNVYFVSADEYFDAVNQIPAGMISRDEDIKAYYAAKNGAERSELDSEIIDRLFFYNSAPWWRVVTARGMLIRERRAEQKLLLEQEGLTFVSCGAYGKSLRVENYSDLIFTEFK